VPLRHDLTLTALFESAVGQAWAIGAEGDPRKPLETAQQTATYAKARAPLEFRPVELREAGIEAVAAMLPRNAGSPKSSFSEIRTLAAGAAGAETEWRVQKTAVLYKGGTTSYKGGTTSSNPSSSSGESVANLTSSPRRRRPHAIFGQHSGDILAEHRLDDPTHSYRNRTIDALFRSVAAHVGVKMAASGSGKPERSALCLRARRRPRHQWQ
jgi:hypothetical protein